MREEGLLSLPPPRLPLDGGWGVDCRPADLCLPPGTITPPTGC